MKLPLSLAAAALAFIPGIALAHAKLIAATPAADTKVASPARISLGFDKPVAGSSVKVEIFMTAMPAGMSHHGGMDHGKMDHSKMDHGKMAAHAPAKIAAIAQLGKDGKSVSLTPKRALSAGIYRVDWTASGADGHKMNGSYTFTVK